MFRTASKVSITSDMWVRLGTPGSEFTFQQLPETGFYHRGSGGVSITGEVEGFLSPDWGDCRKRAFITRKSGAIAENGFLSPRGPSPASGLGSHLSSTAIGTLKSDCSTAKTLNRMKTHRLKISGDSEYNCRFF
jgi:hypothetical protein